MIYPYNIAEADRPRFWKAFHRQRLRYVPTVKRIVSRTMRKQMRAVAEVIEKAQTPEEAKVAALKEVEKRESMIKAMLLSSYLIVSIPFASNSFDSIGKSEKAGKPLRDEWARRVRRHLENRGAEKVVQITETTKKTIAKIIDEEIQEGHGIREIARAIDRGVMLEEIIPNRSLVIARTETISASNLGSLMGAESTGLDLLKEWIATRDERTREDHMAADGQRVDLHAEFSIGGESLEFPGDPKGSAEQVIQCRCVTGYVPKDEA